MVNEIKVTIVTGEVVGGNRGLGKLVEAEVKRRRGGRGEGSVTTIQPFIAGLCPGQCGGGVKKSIYPL